MAKTDYTPTKIDCKCGRKMHQSSEVCSACKGRARKPRTTKRSTEWFIAKSMAVHGDRYDYSLSEYTGAEAPITIICRVCGPFTLASAGSHYSNKKCGCVRCNLGEAIGSRWGKTQKAMVRFHGFVRSTNDFISASRAIHGERYDYSESKFTGANKFLTVICAACGPFQIRAEYHYRQGGGCHACGTSNAIRQTRSLHRFKCDMCGQNGLLRRSVKRSQQGVFCVECADIANIWAARLISLDSKAKRRTKRNLKERTQPWDKWATIKHSMLVTRNNTRNTGTRGSPSRRKSGMDWESWAVFQMKKNYRKKEQGWQLKARRWVANLKRRRRQEKSYWHCLEGSNSDAP